MSLKSLYWPIMAHQVLKLLQQKPQCGAIKTVEFIQQVLTTGDFLRPMITIRFDLKFQIIARLLDSIRNEKTLLTQHY